MRGLRAFFVLAAFFAFTIPLMPLQLLFLATGSRYARTFPHWYHRQVCRIVGIRLNLEGKVAREHGVLLISNHISWLESRSCRPWRQFPSWRSRRSRAGPS